MGEVVCFVTLLASACFVSAAGGRFIMGELRPQLSQRAPAKAASKTTRDHRMGFFIGRSDSSYVRHKRNQWLPPAPCQTKTALYWDPLPQSDWHITNSKIARKLLSPQAECCQYPSSRRRNRPHSCSNCPLSFRSHTPCSCRHHNTCMVVPLEPTHLAQKLLPARKPALR